MGSLIKSVLCKTCNTEMDEVYFPDFIDLSPGKTVEVELYCPGCDAEISTAIIAPRVTA